MLVLALLVGAPAAADEAVSAADKDTARRAMDRGDDLVKEGELAAALKAYRVADDIMGVPTTGLEVGRTLLRLGKLVEARDVLLRVTRFPKEKGEPVPFTKARAKADVLAASLIDRIPTLQLEIVGAEPDATVYVVVDGDPLPTGAHAVPLSMNPGSHSVDVSATPNLHGNVEVELPEGAQQVRTVQLVPGEEVASGEPTDDTPRRPVGSASSADKPVDPTTVTMVVGFTAGGVGAVLGAIFTGLHYSTKAELDDTYGCADRDGACLVPEGDPNEPAKFDALLSESRTYSAVATGGWILAGVGVTVGIIGAILHAGDDENGGDRLGARPPSVAIAPTVGLGYAGLKGTF